MDDIQSWWEVPSIAHFCSLFRAAFNLLDFDIEELEEALLTDGAEDAGSSLLQELIVRLLCGCLGNNDISTFNYQMFLRRLFRQKCQECGRENPFNTDMDFQFLPLRSKVEILHALCDFRLDAEDVQDLLKNLDSDSLRVVPLGHDESNSAYWYFYGTRLYKESYSKSQRKKIKEKRRKGKDDKQRHKKRVKSSSGSDCDELGSGTWQVVCFTEQDWNTVTQVLRNSTSKAERSLYRTLTEDFLPEIPRLFAEKERLQRKRMLDFQPRRQSSRIEKLKQQKVEEEKVVKKEDTIRVVQQEESSRSSMSAVMKETRSARAERRSMSDCGSVYSMVDSNTSAFKPVGRQTNNSLASATGQIVIQGKQRKLRSSLVFKQTEEDLQTGMYKILDNIKNHEDAWPFVSPVEEKYAPRYYSIISKPMDLQRMEDKLDEGDYLSFAEFKADFKLIVDNCRQYNGTENEYTEMVGNLESAFQASVDRYLESDPSSDEEVAIEFPPLESPPSKVHHQTSRKKPRSVSDTQSSGASIASPLSVCSESQSFNEPSQDSRLSPEFDKLRSSQRRTPDFDKVRTTRRCSDFDKLRNARRSPDTESSTAEKEKEEPRPVNNRGRKKTEEVKNSAAIEALHIATAQTLKDINKWLDGTPRYSESFSSASNSPSHFISGEDFDLVGAKIESEYRSRLKMDRPTKSATKEGAKRRAPVSKRREVQRTIQRLQPGKSKGNLLTNLPSKKEDTSKTQSVPGKADDSKLRLSLGTVLSGLFEREKHSFDEVKAEKTPEEKESPPSPVTSQPSPEIEPEPCPTKKPKTEDSPKTEAPMPNHSAWFKAFGAPKAPTTPKRRPEVEVKRSPPQSQEPPRQRKASTGSSMSERSSQDLQDPLDSSPRLILDERLGGYPSAPFPSPIMSASPLHPSPMSASPHMTSPQMTSPQMTSPRTEETSKHPIYTPNGTIRVGFYQDTIQKNSPEKALSPREPPSYTPRSYETGYNYQSYEMPFYDTSKPLTDQYQARPPAPQYPAQQYPAQQYPVQKPTVIPVKKRMYTEMEEPAYQQPGPVNGMQPDISVRDRIQTMQPDLGISKDRLYGMQPNLAMGKDRIQQDFNLGPKDRMHVMQQDLSLGKERMLGIQQDFNLGKDRVHGIQPNLALVKDRMQQDYNVAKNRIQGIQQDLNLSKDRMLGIQQDLSSGKDRMQQDFNLGKDRIHGIPQDLNLSKDRMHGIQQDLSLGKDRMQQDFNLGKDRMHGIPQDLNLSKDRMHGIQQDLSLGKDRMQQDFNLGKDRMHGIPQDLNLGKDRMHGIQQDLSLGKDRMQQDFNLGKERMHGIQPDLTLGKDRMHGSTMTYGQSQPGPGPGAFGTGEKMGLGQYFPMEAPQEAPTSAGYRSAYSPAIDPMRGNLANLSHIVERYPTDAPTYYNQPSVGYQQQPVSYQQPDLAALLNTRQDYAMMPAKPARKRKTKATTEPSAGFQHYSSIKPTETNQVKAVVPGSAFNFGPAPPTLGLYGEKEGYSNFLEEYRTPPSGYYMPEPSRDKAPLPFLPQPRPPSYPQLAQFMNHHQPLMDTASYQQYFQRHQEELMRHTNSPMVLHQGLLAPPTTYPPGYHPALRQPYDALNRPSWL